MTNFTEQNLIKDSHYIHYCPEDNGTDNNLEVVSESR